MGFETPAYTTQLYVPGPFDNDLDANGTPDKVVDAGELTDLDAIALEDDVITLTDLDESGAQFSDLVANTLTLNNDPLAYGFFDTTLNIVMPLDFQTTLMQELLGDINGDGSVTFPDFLILFSQLWNDRGRRHAW